MNTESFTARTHESDIGPEPVVNVAAYHFAPLDDLQRRRRDLLHLCREENLKGTILLSPEGINLFVAGSRPGVNRLLMSLRNDPLLSGIEVKESLSGHQPFERMLVKIKPEIIAFGVEGIDPLQYTSPRLPASQLRDWLRQGKDCVLLDVRNNYEFRVGTFAGAVAVDVDHFRDFPQAVERLPDEYRDKPIVTFCTGGIRCEKAAPYLERAGFKHVYQLEGGILKYFEVVGGEFYRGECFVFDKRVALGPDLKETATTQCYACLSPLTVEDQQSPLYDPPHACPHCHEDETTQRQRLIEQRHRRIRTVATPLPGSVPYDNARPLNVPERFDGLTLLEFLCQFHPHLGKEHWSREIDAGRIQKQYRRIPAGQIVRGGEQYAHLHPGTVEPNVNANIRIVYEDDALVAVNKPAPLPLHPSGRFHRNTLQWILNAVYHPLKLKPAHRLDADTTGLVLFSKTREVARSLQPQFEAGTVNKEYLARVQGHVHWESILCDAPISREPGEYGGRTIDELGLPSRSRFEVLSRDADGTTLLRCVPETGRTNQLRIHLRHLGYPILGDSLYLPDGTLGTKQTDEPGTTMCLHAWRLTFDHPRTGERATLQAPSPDWAPQSALD